LESEEKVYVKDWYVVVNDETVPTVVQGPEVLDEYATVNDGAVGEVELRRYQNVSVPGDAINGVMIASLFALKVAHRVPVRGLFVPCVTEL
jgi:hypothetical protein